MLVLRAVTDINPALPKRLPVGAQFQETAFTGAIVRKEVKALEALAIKGKQVLKSVSAMEGRDEWPIAIMSS